jgi:hypothetical protein
VNSHLLTLGLLFRWQRAKDASWRKAAVTSVAALLLLGTWMLCAPVAFAKEKKPPTRTVSGVVLDEAENGIEGATVELTDLQTKKVLEIYSQEGGQYQYTDLSPSHDYTIKATYKGASSEVRQVSSVDIRPRLVLNLTIPTPKH